MAVLGHHRLPGSLKSWIFPAWIAEEQQEEALLHFPHGIPALGGGRNEAQGCSAAPRMSHGSSQAVFFPTNIAQTKQTKQLVAGASSLGRLRDGSVLWVGGQGVASGTGTGTPQALCGVRFGNTQTPKECGVQKGTAALGLVLRPLQVSVTIVGCPCCVPNTSHGDRPSVAAPSQLPDPTGVALP